MASPYKHSASERESARKSPQARTAGPVTKKYKNTPKGNGATVGSAAKAVGKAVNDVGTAVDKAIPSRKASGVVPSTMKNLPKGGVMGVINKKKR